MLHLFRSTATMAAAAIGAAGVFVALYAWQLPPFTSTVQVTDNAYVRGQITLIGSQLPGYVAEVAVQDFQEVKAGQLLVRLDGRIFVQKLNQAKATLASQRAALANSEQQRLSGEARVAASEAQVNSAAAAHRAAEAGWHRVEPLLQRGVVTQNEGDDRRAAHERAQAALSQAEAALEVSRQDLTAIVVGRQSLEAAVQGAEAAVELAAIDLQNTRIAAPKDGRLGEIGARQGQYVSAGTQLMALVPDRIWVVANFKETQLAGMQVGQPVTLTVDALQHADLRGRIERFSPAAGSEFSILRPDNATGNFTKIAQRVPVRVEIDPDQELARQLTPGMSVVVSVDTAQATPADVSATGGVGRTSPARPSSAVVRTEDVEKTAAWYRDRLGFRVTSDRTTVQGRSVVVERNGALLEISEEDAAPQASEGQPGPSVTLLVEDVDAEVERLRTGGVEILAEPRDDATAHFRVARILDGDGRRVKLREPIDPDASGA